MASYSNGAREEEPHSPADQVVEDLVTRWSDANKRSDRGGIVALYDPKALFYGSRSELKIGAEGIREYFDGVVPGSVRDVWFGERTVSQIAENVIVAAAFVDFDLLQEDGPDHRRWRIMWTVTRGESGRWSISGHHAAPREW